MMNEAKQRISLRRNREYKKSFLSTDELDVIKKKQRTRALEYQKLVIKKPHIYRLEEKVKKNLTLESKDRK